jgi:hypothetical protein
MATTNPTINVDPTINVGGVERPMTDQEFAAYNQTIADTNSQAQVWNDDMRRAAYEAESDPLFFKWQRGESTQQAWLDKIAEIQTQYPNPSA